jgi:hypothetical protein
MECSARLRCADAGLRARVALAVASMLALGVFLASRPGAYGSRMDYATTGSMAVAAADLDGNGRRDVIAGGGWAGSA